MKLPRFSVPPWNPIRFIPKMEGDRLVIHASTQVPWHLRRIVARVLGIKENRIQIIKERTGGAYGSKQDILLEELAAWVTWNSGQSVFYQYTREEEFIACSTRFPMKMGVKLGAKKRRNPDSCSYDGGRQLRSLREPLSDRSHERLLQVAAPLPL